MGYHFLLQRIFQTQELNPGLLHCRQILYCLSHQGSPCDAISSVQFSRSAVSNSLRPHESQHTLSITNSQSLLKLMPIESVMLSNHLILCRPLLLLPPILPSIRVFSNESVLHMRWRKYWSFSFSISPSSEHPGLISLSGLVGSPCSPRDSPEYSPTPQFRRLSSSVLSFLYSPTLTSIHDH